MDSSTGIRHSQDILGNLLATKEEGMNLSERGKKKKHSAKYYKDIEKAKNQIKNAESSMKQMDTEVK